MKYLSIGMATTLMVMSFFLFTAYTGEETIAEEAPTTDDTLQEVKHIRTPKNPTLGGEIIPMDIFDVRERLDRELLVNTYWHSNTIQCIKLANRYFPVMEPILAEYGVPDDFKYLAVAESALRNATSPAGAKGLWQFMKSAGTTFGLEINKEVDERYHVEKATIAACKYLLEEKKRHGNWIYAAAAYNMGSGGLRKNVREQKAKSYFDLNLNAETARYVFRIVAFKEILSNQELYGFKIPVEERYAPLTDYYIIQVEEPVTSWADFAEKYGISYRTLKVYNPWILSSSLTNKSKKMYKVKIPKK